MGWPWIFLGIVIGILFAYLFLCYYIAKLVSNPKYFSREEHRAYNKEKGNDVGSEILTRTPITFTMRDKYVIHGDYSLLNPKKFIILCHGHASTREGELIYATMFYKLGYSIILYDERGCGDNKKVPITMGYKEAKDLNEIIKQVYDKFGQDIFLGVHGTSMGAATALLVTQYHPNLKFIIADCGYCKLIQVIRWKVKKSHLHGYLYMPGTEFWFRLLYGYSFRKSSPYYYIHKNTIPTLIVHGDSDDFVLPHHGYDNYHRLTCEKYLEFYPNAPHVGSIKSDPERYQKMVQDFIQKQESKQNENKTIK